MKEILAFAAVIIGYSIGIALCYMVVTYRWLKRREPHDRFGIQDDKETAIPIALFWPFTIACCLVYLLLIRPCVVLSQRWEAYLIPPPPPADPFLVQATAEVDALLKESA